MMLIRTLIFLVALITYPLRLALYLVHAFLYFFTKPGAATIVALVVLIVATLVYGAGNELAVGIPELIGGFLFGLVGGEWGRVFYDWRGLITLALGYFVLGWAVSIIGALFRGIIHALPAPRRPFLPMAPMRIPKHVIRTVPASVEVKPAGRSRFQGSVARLVPNLAPDIRAVLTPNAIKPPQAALAAPPAALPPPSAAPASMPAAMSQERPPAELPAPTPPRPTSPAEAWVPGRRRPVSGQEPSREES